MFSYVNLQCKAMPQMQRGEPDLILSVECDSSFIGQSSFAIHIEHQIEQRLQISVFNYGVSFSDMYVTAD
ncbi:hypothetical protein T07_2949 [Trichinella nelsoni]|uniref:Uncharacterized protein n=1 Tax=Trichinella nelsoni TaxID=6336 RepID=A0A0V0RVR7_9BILA|nr:hypothetical protein T07_2949 [Trichinella nelsoni]